MHGKWTFARPLLLEGEDEYSKWIADLWQMLLSAHPNDVERQRHFFEYAVHTERMTVEMVSEYLKQFQFYWTGKGVQLTDHELRGYF